VTALWQVAMIRLARSGRVRDLVQRQPRMTGLAARFVGGTDVAGALATARALRAQGIGATLYYLGEYLVKGAFAEPATVAARRGEQISHWYRRGAAALLSQQARAAGCYPSFATHDDLIIEEIISIADASGRPDDSFEFEMLYGVRPDLQCALARRGYRVRVYVPVGADWFPYAIRRVGESLATCASP
jgi:proline dehydrogenase